MFVPHRAGHGVAAPQHLSGLGRVERDLRRGAIDDDGHRAAFRAPNARRILEASGASLPGR